MKHSPSHIPSLEVGIRAQLRYRVPGAESTEGLAQGAKSGSPAVMRLEPREKPRALVVRSGKL